MTTFFKKGNIYWARHVASIYYNLLGLVFSEKETTQEIEVIELYDQESDTTSIPISKEEIVAQVKSGLKRFNEAMNTHYSVSKIIYPPCRESRPNFYDSLTGQIVRRYHQQEDFPDYSEKNDTKEDDSS